MSYILEALKKSQQQHEQQLTSAAAVITATPPASRFWPNWLLVLLSLVSLLVLVLVLLWHSYGQVTFQATESVPAIMATGNDLKASNASSAAPEDTLESSVSSETPTLVTSVMPPVAATAVTTATLASRPVATVNIESASPESANLKSAKSANAIPTSTQADGETDNVGTASHQPRVQTRTLPPLSSLRKVPDLIITGHIYSSIASQRQVTMNGRLWSESDPIAEGVRLQHITRDGIELEVDGWPLTLHRNRGWQSLTD